MSSIEISNPATKAEAVTPSDVTDLADPTQAVYVGTGGDVEAILVGDTGNARVFKNVNSGQVLPIQVTRIKAANTTATDILALYNR